MRLQIRLWLVFSLLWLVGLSAVYLFLSDLYKERTFENEKELALSQAATVAERLSGLMPKFPERAEGYVDYYSSLFGTRLFMLDEDKRTLYDSSKQFAAGYRLELDALSPGRTPPVSLFKNTVSYGYVQYTVLDMSAPGHTGYLLMVRDANGVFDDIRKFRNHMLTFLGAASAIGFLVFYALAKLFTRPIRQIIAHLQLITPQNRTFALAYRRNDEIGKLIDRIRQMVRELNEYEKRQRRFISASSHELKTPLATMQLIVENLPHVFDQETLRQEYTDDLQLQIDKMKQTVHGMIDVYRLADKPVHRQPLAMDDICRHVDAELQHLAQSKQIRIVYATDGSGLDADAALLFRALDNLVANAIRYSPEGTDIRVSLRSAGPRHTECSVCDQGIGISEEDLPYVFEPFYRSRTASAWNPEGSGLGLAIVKQTVELHGGDIRVESAENRGTCFRMTFRNNSVT